MTDVISRELAVPEDDLELRADAELEQPIEGEIVEAEPPAPKVYVLRPVTQVFQSITVVVQHPHTKKAVRHAGYVAAGAVVTYRRRQRGRGFALDMGHQAKAAGDHANAHLWAKQAEEERQKRHERSQRRLQMAIDLLKVSHWLLLAAVVFLLLVGIAMAAAQKRPADLVAPFMAVAHTVTTLYEVAAVTWRPVLIAAPFLALLWLYATGRRGDALAPGWGMAREAEEERGLVVTADGIVVALQNLSLPKLDKAFKEGWQPAFRLTPIKDGEGYSAIFSLPMGVTPGMIADKNEVFARNLHRAKTEVWPTDAERDGVAAAGFVNLWVANPGVLDRPAPEWPLLASGTADVFKGVPAGVTARGNPVLIPIVGNNFSIGGLMGQGKSNACRVVMLGAALDPLAELLVHVFAYNGDFDCFEPRLARYVKGAEEEQIDAAMETLNRMYEEVGEREQMIADLGAKKVTRQIAAKHPELRPRMTLFSECHELFGHKEYGEEATELAVKTIRRARKTAIWMGFDTQDSRKDAIPPRLLSLVSIRNCLPVTTWRANDGFLWDGAFQSGVRATELRPGRDIGRSITSGISNEQFEILKWHYIFSDDDSGKDDAAPVIARAMANLAPGTAVAGMLPAAPVVVRDLLDDLAEVIEGPDRVNVNDLPNRLRRLDPSWAAYKKLTGRQLRELLRDEGVRVFNTDNRPELDPADLERARTDRELGE